MSYDTANCARVYQHDVRAKQTKVCDAARAGFQTPTHSSNYLKTDGQLIVQGRTACSIPSMTVLAAVFPPVDNINSFLVGKILLSDIKCRKICKRKSAKISV